MNIINLGSRVVNNYIYPIKDAYVLMDTGYKNSYDHFNKMLEKHNISSQDISYVFLTHAHDDHAGFLNQLLSDCPNIKVVLSEKGLEALRSGQNIFIGGCSGILALLFCKFMALLGNEDHSFPPINKDFESRYILIEHTDKVALENLLGGNIIETAGHTSCSISLLLNSGVLFCGDAAMNNFPSIRRIIIHLENVEDFYQSWQKIISINPKIVYPTHGKPFPVTDLKKFLPDIRKIKLLPLKNKLLIK